MAPPKPAHLEPSELGTKQYWDNLYKTELANHASNPEDKGTVWFDDADAEAKMVQFLADLDAEGALQVSNVLDLGCGNGSLLRAVRDELWADGGPETKLRLLGVDYSEASVQLAKSIDTDDDDDDDVKPIEFSVWDMLEGTAADLATDGVAACWDLILDKGTFDAISLGNAEAVGSTEEPADVPADTPRPTPVEIRYRRQVLSLLRDGGRFLITSCNWTEPELCAWMEDEEDDGQDGQGARLVKTGRVAYPSYQFGGVQGQTVCTVLFEKRELI